MEVMRSTLLFVLSCILVVKCDKVLFNTYVQGRSHMFSMLPVAQKLTEHQVSTFFEIVNPGFSFGEVIKDETILLNTRPVHLNSADYKNVWKVDSLSSHIPQMWTSMAQSTNRLFSNQRTDLNKITNQTWQLLIFDPCWGSTGIALVKMTGSPYIHFFTSMVDPLYTYYKGLGRSLAAAPLTSTSTRHDNPFWNPNRFKDRLMVVCDTVVYLMIQWSVEPVLTELLSEIDGSEFNFRQFYGEDLLTIYDYFDKLNFAMPTSNQFVSTGAFCGQPKSLEPQFESFINGTKSAGTIIMAFGHFVSWDWAPAAVRKTWVEILTELKEFRIIWGMERVEEMTKVIGPLPSHVMLTDWLPQTDLLAHKSTKLFISHGGLKSVKETICAEVPALFMSMFADQLHNALLAKTYGFGEYVNKLKVNTSEIVKIIRKMTSQTSYYQNVKKTKGLWLDRVIPGLDEVTFKVKQVLKYGRLPKKYSAINFEASWIRFLFIDIIIFPFLLFLLIQT